ncbi:MAG: hypothetical protein AB7T06_01240 [Kofleriaceae bacterium]
MAATALPHVSSLILAATAVFAADRGCEAIESPNMDVREAECETDDDCGLMPSRLTCCGECEPAPPFEAVPRSQIDALLIELDTQCAPRTRLCEPPVCEEVPFECEARAACIAGVCRAIASSACSVRVADDAW